MNCHVQELNGNSDQSSLAHQWTYFYARFVRFVPLTWVGQQCMRVELHGCKETIVQIDDLQKYLKNGTSW